MSQVSVLELRRRAAEILKPAMGEETPAAERALICGAWRWTLTDLALHQQDLVDEERVEQILDMANRMARHEPLQYVVGHCDFCGIEMASAPGALIPRPETEQLVEAVVEWAEGRKGLRAMDIGTGSGCIAASLSEMLVEPKVVAVDVSDEALAVARQNVSGRRVELRKVDILTANVDELGEYDIVVSNPPYVMQKEREAMEANVLDYEPGLALFVPDDDPLIFYRRIATLCRGGLLARGGALFFEINEALGTEMSAMLSGMGFADVEIRKDYLGKDRIAVCTKL